MSASERRSVQSGTGDKERESSQVRDFIDGNTEGRR